MPTLFSPDTLKGVTVPNRIAMSPMTMYQLTDGSLDDYHVMHRGAGAGAGAGAGFGLVFPEHVAILIEGRTGVGCGGIYDDAHIEGLARVASIHMEGARIQLGPTGRNGHTTPDTTAHNQNSALVSPARPTPGHLSAVCHQASVNGSSPRRRSSSMFTASRFPRRGTSMHRQP